MAIEILIVDDNADIRNILNELILDAGYKLELLQTITKHYLKSIKNARCCNLRCKIR